MSGSALKPLEVFADDEAVVSGGCMRTFTFTCSKPFKPQRLIRGCKYDYEIVDLKVGAISQIDSFERVIASALEAESARGTISFDAVLTAVIFQMKVLNPHYFAVTVRPSWMGVTLA